MHENRPDPIGPHDLGGQEASALERADHDLAWWERQVDAMINLLIERGLMKDVAQLRNGIERLGPDAYERLSYYERWAASAAHIAVEAGVVSEQEIEERIAAIRKRNAAT